MADQNAKPIRCPQSVEEARSNSESVLSKGVKSPPIGTPPSTSNARQLAAIRQAIRRGQYAIDPYRIAEAFMADEKMSKH